MNKPAWIMVALCAAVAGCGGPPPPGSAASGSGSAADQCGVCQFENPGNPDACAQLCLASGQWVRYGPTPPGR
jgi:hypothetical protein